MTSVGRLFATFVSRWPFASGSGRIIGAFDKGIDVGAGLREVPTIDGFRISALPDDVIGRHIIPSGQFDRSVIAVLIDFAERGNQCLDIDTNIHIARSRRRALRERSVHRCEIELPA